MTKLQAQACQLIKQLPEDKLTQAVELLNGLLDRQSFSKGSNGSMPSRKNDELFQKWMALREETLKYSFEDVETARKNAIAEKYGVIL